MLRATYGQARRWHNVALTTVNEWGVEKEHKTQHGTPTIVSHHAGSLAAPSDGLTGDISSLLKVHVAHRHAERNPAHVL
jgi:hypothetical protein